MTPQDVPLVESVFHPSDFSPESENAFAHALAIALLRQTSFTILHVGASAEGSWTEFPGVRQTLERWRLLEPGSPRSAVFDELSIRVRKVRLQSRHPLSAILDYLDDHPTDLIVLSTEGREGLPGWVRPSLAEEMARRSGTMTLFVPKGVEGFVTTEDGHLSLRNVLVPVDREPDPQQALVRVTRAARALGDGVVGIHLLHVGESMPELAALPEDPAWRWHRSLRQGDPVEEILSSAEACRADLIVMATAGREGILDALRGSTTEQILRRANCPLLAVPA